MRDGKGGVWRIPPKIGGCQRSPLPRFTVLNERETKNLTDFFTAWSSLINRVLVPGGHVFVASNSLLAPLVFNAVISGGLEPRGQIIRLVRTMRGGDKPKGAEIEFGNVSTMTRSCHEPWGVFRKKIEVTVSDNLRVWKTGGLQRLSVDSPLPDVIQCQRTPETEREIARHPNIKPQAFLRQLVKASLPLGQGVILDPFMGSGSTVAAAEFVGYQSIGIELDSEYYKMATRAVPQLANLYPEKQQSSLLVGYR